MQEISLQHLYSASVHYTVKSWESEDFLRSMWHRGPKPVACRFWLFLLSHILYTASASKYILQNQISCF